MIYASDLDRTLIFSERFISENKVSKKNLTLVDECSLNSYISNNVAKMISHIVSEGTVRFIPVTTRSTEQFKRIQFRKVGIPIEYAIVANGGVILHQGERLKDWEDYLNTQMPDSDSFEAIISAFNSIDSIDYKTKTVDERFIFTKCKDSTDAKASVKIEVDEIKKDFPHFGFYMYNNKVYAIPKCFGKDITLNWLKHRLNEDRILSSGDSSFDIPMLSTSDFRVVPDHCSIGSEDLRKLGVFVVNGGVESALKTMAIVENKSR